MKHYNLRFLQSLIIGVSLLFGIANAAEFPMVINPVATATPPGAKVSAAYFTLVNESKKDLTITGAYSPEITKLEIHLSKMDGDVASMEKQDKVIVKAGEEFKFEHGGYHIMLMGLMSPLKENDSVDVILETSEGDMLIEVPVRKSAHAMHGDKKMAGDVKDKSKMNHEHAHAEPSETKMQTKKDGADHKAQTKEVH